MTDKQFKKLKKIIPSRWCLRYKIKTRNKYLFCEKDAHKGIKDYSCDECLKRHLEKILEGD